jgi:hypothetical protein
LADTKTSIASAGTSIASAKTAIANAIQQAYGPLQKANYNWAAFGKQMGFNAADFALTIGAVGVAGLAINNWVLPMALQGIQNASDTNSTVIGNSTGTPHPATGQQAQSTEQTLAQYKMFGNMMLATGASLTGLIGFALGAKTAVWKGIHPPQIDITENLWKTTEKKLRAELNDPDSQEVKHLSDTEKRRLAEVLDFVGMHFSLVKTEKPELIKPGTLLNQHLNFLKFFTKNQESFKPDTGWEAAVKGPEGDAARAALQAELDATKKFSNRYIAEGDKLSYSAETGRTNGDSEEGRRVLARDTTRNFRLIKGAASREYVLPFEKTWHPEDGPLPETSQEWEALDDWHKLPSFPKTLPNLTHMLYSEAGGTGKSVFANEISDENLDLPTLQDGGIRSLGDKGWDPFAQPDFPTSRPDALGALVALLYDAMKYGKKQRITIHLEEVNWDDVNGIKKMLDLFKKNFRSQGMQKDFKFDVNWIVTTNHLPQKSKEQPTEKQAILGMDIALRDRLPITWMPPVGEEGVKLNVIQAYQTWAPVFYAKPKTHDEDHHGNGQPFLTPEEERRMQHLFRTQAYPALVAAHSKLYSGQPLSRVITHMPQILSMIVWKIIDEREHKLDGTPKEPEPIAPLDIKTWIRAYYAKYEEVPESEAFQEKLEKSMDLFNQLTPEQMLEYAQRLTEAAYAKQQALVEEATVLPPVTEEELEAEMAALRSAAKGKQKKPLPDDPRLKRFTKDARLSLPSARRLQPETSTTLRRTQTLRRPPSASSTLVAENSRINRTAEPQRLDPLFEEVTDLHNPASRHKNMQADQNES